MSIGLPAVAIIEFDAAIKAAYQNASLLRPHVRVKTGVTGATHRFRRFNRGIATPRVPQTDIVPMGQTYGDAIATLTDWFAGDYTDRVDQALVNFDEREVLVTNTAMACGRREDQMIIAALDAANPSATIAAGGTGLTFDKMRQIVRFFDQRAVPMGQRKLVISAQQKQDLIGENRFTSGDWVTAGTMASGEVTRLLGMDIVTMENRAEGGLPLVSTTRTVFAFDMQAVGLAVAVDKTATVDWIGEKRAWLVGMDLKAGAVAIDPEGIIEIDCTET